MFRKLFNGWLGIFSVLCSIATGCGTLPNGRGWGQDATLLPGWRQLGDAALHAALDPGTWVPAVGAGILQLNRWDVRISRWASKKTPIFGSQENAEKYSDYFLSTSEAVFVASALATPSGDKPGDWVVAKLKGLCVGVAAATLTRVGSDYLEQATRRTRPNRANHLSFPSAHASMSSVTDTLASRNIEFISMPEGMRTGLRVGFAALTVGTAWARVEAKMHFPADVLAGMALGRFLGAFINDAFLGAKKNEVSVSIESSMKDIYASVQWTF